MLPCEELDIFDAANSLELPAKGSVCWSRSGLPDCMPENDNQRELSKSDSAEKTRHSDTPTALNSMAMMSHCRIPTFV